jgi:hypothetical protein
MIIDDFHLIGISRFPVKADSPSIVDTYAVLPTPISMQKLQPIARWYKQVIQCHGPIQHPQFSECNLLNIVGKLFGKGAVENRFGFLALKRPYHTS